MADNPTRHVRRDPEGVLLVAYEQVDPTVAYFRRTWGEWTEKDAGLWAGLAPDIPPTLTAPSNPVWLLDQLALDGPVRATLLDLGVSKVEWDAATPTQRTAVIRALRAAQQVNETVRAVIKGSGDRLRKTGVSALVTFARLVETDAKVKNRKGHGSYRKRSERQARALRLFDVINNLLLGAQAEARAAKKGTNLFNRAPWVEEIVDSVNFIGTMTSMPTRVEFTKADLLLIRGKGTVEVARNIAQRTFPDVAREVLERGIRDRTAGKKSTSGPAR